MKLEVHINKKVALVVLGVMFILAGGLVYAYGTSSPSTIGHTSGEISGTLRTYDCYWTSKSRCNGCTRTRECNRGEVVDGLRHQSTGETHVDYVWVRCCKIGF